MRCPEYRIVTRIIAAARNTVRSIYVGTVVGAIVGASIRATVSTR
jgi:hypothetical protein